MKKEYIIGLIAAAMAVNACSDNLNIDNGYTSSKQETFEATAVYDKLPYVYLSDIIDMESGTSSKAYISCHEGNGAYKLEMEEVRFSLAETDKDFKMTLVEGLELPSAITTGYYDLHADKTLDPFLSLSGLQMNMVITNPSSETLVLDADLISYRSGEAKNTVHIGDNGGSEGNRRIEVAPGSSARFILSENGDRGNDENAVKLAAPGLNSLFLSIPDRLEIANILFNGNDSFESAEPVEFSFELSAPLAIGAKTYFTTAYDFYGMDLSLPDGSGDDVCIDAIDIEYSLLSAIPVLLTFDIYPIDADGNIVEGVVCGGFGNAFAGTDSKPSVARNMIRLEEKAGFKGQNLLKKVEGLKMYISVRGSSEKRHQSISLTSRDYLLFHDITIGFHGQVE